MSELEHYQVTFGWFDGILEGKRRDDEALQACVESLNSIGMVHLDLQPEGGKFSILADDSILSSGNLTTAGKERFVEELQKLILSQGPESNIESTLRCTVVEGDTVQETLFAVSGTELKPLTREREATEEDRAHVPAVAEPEVFPLVDFISREPKKALLIGFLALGVLILSAWQSGFIHRLRTPGVDRVTVDTGSFGNLINVTAESAWGKYSVTLKRGPGYPAGGEDADKLLAEAETVEQRAAVNAVINGETVFIRLEDKNGIVLSAEPVSLRPLLRPDGGRVSVKIPGHMNTVYIAVSLDSGLKK